MRLLANCLNFAQRQLAPACLLCGGPLNKGPTQKPSWLCTPCDADLPRLAIQRCAVCALPLTAGDRCGACLADPPAYDHVCAAFEYAFPVDALILSLKYASRLAIAPLLGHALARALTPAQPPDVLVPMPLSDARLRERGFNQSQEIARHVAQRTAIALIADACRKTRETPPQAALPWKERAKNVRNAYVCDADFSGQHVGVVDDVMTTGATLNELAKKLKQRGATRITGLIVARTLPFGDRTAHV